MPPPSVSTGISITNPLVLYRSLVATKRIDTDPAQYRLAIHLQNLYDQLKDYEPILQYGYRLQQISRALDSSPGKTMDGTAYPQPRSTLSSLFDRKQDNDGLALTRILTSHESALELDSPKGLMLHGEVGTGKSMLIDLFADCLPSRKKRRWHFTTFMLETMAKLEQLRRSRQMIIPASLGQQDDYSLLWLARDLIATSPIIFLDEFQLPDRAASKIMTNLMTNFFHLGGVLIATSNRMPEELAKAAGMEFAPPVMNEGSLAWRLGLRSAPQNRGPQKTEFAKFLDVLKARCDIWEMENGKDYRRRESELEASQDRERAHPTASGLDGLENIVTGNIGLGHEQSTPTDRSSITTPAASLPQSYLLTSSPDHTTALTSLQLRAVGLPCEGPASVPWKASTIRVYGRDVPLPRTHGSIVCFTFDELCGSALGPADYITIASSYHTLILLDVPVLSILQKNEARRFITLLDALYEARCKLLVTAAAGPDDIFFPESRKPASPDASVEEMVTQDATYAETMSEVYQDATAPFRPNISIYDDGGSGFSSASADDPFAVESGSVDYTHSRLAGAMRDERDTNPPDELEDGPPNTIRHGDSIHGRSSTKRGPDFQQSGIFTGEDEKFAYKRARSRLWEMCGAKWWARGEAGEEWWRPLDQSVRTWERSATEGSFVAGPTGAGEVPAGPGEGMTGSRNISEEQDDVLFKHGASPFRKSADPPPKMGWEHVWGMVRWGKKAGNWGKGVEGVEERRKEKGRGTEDEGEGEGEKK